MDEESRVLSLNLMNGELTVHRLSQNKPSSSSKSAICCRFVKLTCIILLVLVLLFFLSLLIIATVFRLSVNWQRSSMFRHQRKSVVPHPEKVGLNQCTKQLQLPSDDSIQLGVWYIAPNELHNCTKQRSMFIQKDNPDRWFSTDNRLVVLYAHGISSQRGATHRIHRYKVWSNSMQYHVIAFDYRGFGDSTYRLPTAQGLANDTFAVYRWLLQQGVHHKRILLWGHSMGSAVQLRMLSDLSTRNVSYPLGAGLENPFTDIAEVIRGLIRRTPYTIFPFAEYFFVDPIVHNPESNFNSTALIPHIACPLLILHPQDDLIVPFRLGHRLYETAREAQPMQVRGRTTLMAFDAEHQYGHHRVFDHPNITQIITDFVASIQYTNVTN